MYHIKEFRMKNIFRIYFNLHNATNHSTLKVRDIQSIFLCPLDEQQPSAAERAAIFKPNLKSIISSRGNAQPNPKKCSFAYHFLVIDFYCFIRLINAVPHAASLYRGSPNVLQLSSCVGRLLCLFFWSGSLWISCVFLFSVNYSTITASSPWCLWWNMKHPRGFDYGKLRS